MGEQVSTRATYEQSLTTLLALVDDARTPSEALEAAARRCTEAFEAQRARAVDIEDVKRCRSVLAVLRAACTHELERSAQRLQLARAARRAFAGQTVAADGGSACDCAG